MHVLVWRRVCRAALAAAVAGGAQPGAHAAAVPVDSILPLTGAVSPARAPVLLAQAGRGLGVLAPALPMPVKPPASVGVTAELLPCPPAAAPAGEAAPDAPGAAGTGANDASANHAPASTASGQAESGNATPGNAAPGNAASADKTSAGDPAAGAPATGAASGGDAADISRLDPQPGGSSPEGELVGCPVVPTAASEAADATAGGLDLDYVPLPPGSTPVKWGRPLGTPKPWFAGVTPEGGMQLGDRSLTYRSVDGPSVSLGSLTPFAPAWSSAATIGGVQVSNLSAGSDSTVPEGKLGYSSVWGRINNTDPSVTAGGVQYGAPAGSNAVRYGLTPDVTLEGQVQSARALTTTGLGTTYSMGQWGTLQGGATQSHFDTAQGWRYNLGYNVKVFDTVRLGYGNELTSSGYGDLSTYQDGAATTSQLRNTFSAGVPISGWGELSGTYSGLRDTSGEMLERRYGISQSMMLSPNVRLAVGADHDVITGDYGVNMQLTMPLGGR